MLHGTHEWYRDIGDWKLGPSEQKVNQNTNLLHLELDCGLHLIDLSHH